MKVISFHESDRQDHWLEEIKRSNWQSGAFLYDLLSQGTFFDTVGESSKVLLLIDGDELISYCTYAQKDDIQPTELMPWMGFVYTFPVHRGHRYVGLLFDEIERLAQEEHVSQVYISTNHEGLYEKYGCEFVTTMNDMNGNPSRVYIKKIEPERNIELAQEEPHEESQEGPEYKSIILPPIPIIENENVEQLKNESNCDEVQKTKDTLPKSKLKKALRYLTSKKKRAVLRRAFHIWQITPPKLAPISESTHKCASCGTEFQGNYCPRCGQPSGVGRFSFKKAIQQFLNVWGMGNRSMFRSIRDLILRPGYMIRDYLSGMQSAYFPPFKMFFIFVAISLLVQHGLNFGVEEKRELQSAPKTELMQQQNKQQQQKTNTIEENGEKTESDQTPLKIVGVKFTNMMNTLNEKNPAIFSLIALMLFFWPLFFFLRKTPKIPDLRFSEFIVALVYTSNSYSIFSIIGDLLNFDLIKFIAVIMIFVTIHQFSGYKKGRILGYMILTCIISVIVLIIITFVGMVIGLFFVSK